MNGLKDFDNGIWYRIRAEPGDGQNDASASSVMPSLQSERWKEDRFEDTMDEIIMSLARLQTKEERLMYIAQRWKECESQLPKESIEGVERTFERLFDKVNGWPD